MITPKNIALVVALMIIAGAVFYLQSGKTTAPVIRQELVSVASGTISNISISTSSATSTPTPRVSDRSAIRRQKAANPNYYPAVEIVQPTGFINAAPFNLASLVGKKVILIDFWTYSCINCIRTIPYLNSWYKKYKDKGFVIVGVHSPEFEFEKKYENVAANVKKLGIEYPVVLDSNFGTWNAYGNNSWPSEYLIDVDGFVIHHTIGEGRYEETEREIQNALAEKMAALGESSAPAAGVSAPVSALGVDFSKVKSPEIYFGSARNKYLGNGVKNKVGVQSFTRPNENEIVPNTLYLAGVWKIRDQFAENVGGDARIVFKYNSRRVFMVASAEEPVAVTLLRDGKNAGDVAGPDGVLGGATIQDERLYWLIDDESGYGEHTLEIIIKNPGLKAFTFTFG